MHTNARMDALRASAERTARAMTNDRTLKVVVSPTAAKYDHRTHTLYVPAYRTDDANPAALGAFRGTLDHEIAHVNYSDVTLFERPCTRAQHLIWNAFEDLYVERRHVKDWPGAATNLDALHAWYAAKTTVGEATDPEQQGSLFLALALGIKRVGEGDPDPDTLAEFHAQTAELYALCADEIAAGCAATNSTECFDAGKAVYDKVQAALAPEDRDDEEAESADDEPAGPESADDEPAEPEEGGGEPAEPEGEQAPQALVPATATPDGPAAPGVQLIPGAALSPETQAALKAALERGGDDATPSSGTFVILGVPGDIAMDYWRGAAPPYTATPAVLAADKVVTYTAADRARMAPLAEEFMVAAGPTVSKLVGYLSGAVNASRQSLTIGAQEDGDDLDLDALATIALGINGPDIFTTVMRQIEESTYVQVMVDCSGSMGGARPGSTSKATHAAVTAMALHAALRACRIEHSVIGYTTGGSLNGGWGHRTPMPEGAFAEWSRDSTLAKHLHFVEAPGTNDSGAALAAIDGDCANLDAEAVLYGAAYAAKHGGSADRVIMLVIADGMPAGMDDYAMNGPALEQAVEHTARSQIEVYGIGLELRGHAEDFARFYPDRPAEPGRAPTGSMQVSARDGLTDDVLRALAELLTRGYGLSRKVS